ncbi:MAG: translation elongation factor 4 [Aquificaceae bacterium]|nr:translation elongation factor 4 [Aquificaceae bacterium]MDW8237525.1 translation elongation factor 4 [Aquificaceae bacterium]
MELIRNFSIIAHVDHGKSTLADRLLEYTKTVSSRELKEQMLDTLDIERERGITIKLQAVRMLYHALDGKEYTLHLIDTPGHVDFSYEVSRALAACEGALLLVDATQGIQAQTVANFWKAVEQELIIIPVINKIDLPSAQPERVITQIEEILGLSSQDVILASAKEGIGIKEILEAIVNRIPPPKGNQDAPLKALIFDSFYDAYRGAVAFIRVMDGSLRPGTRIRLFSTGKEFEVTEVGAQMPKLSKLSSLSAGDVGYICASIKDVRDIRVGDTITDAKNPTLSAIPGFRPAKPMVFAGVYPSEGYTFEELRDAIEKFAINDASIQFETETSPAIGLGYRMGFLGLLHMEIVQERLEREFNISIITTAPSVVYRVNLKRGQTIEIKNPSELPENWGEIDSILEPFVFLTVITPSEYLGATMGLLQEKRGIQKKFSYLDKFTTLLEYEAPLSEIIMDFHDKIKGLSKGFATYDYEFLEFRKEDLVRLNIFINNEPIDALSFIVHREKAYRRARQLVEKLKDVIPRQLFEVKVQAGIGSKIIASERIPPLRANVTAKCYGGDITRKKKLLEKQKEGKKRLKQFGRVELPQEAFLSVLKVD